MGASEEFDKLLQEVGTRGRFQVKTLCFFILPFVVTYSLFNNYIFLLAVPDHWCHVPGRENTSFSIEQWKELTIPKVGSVYSQCSHYVVNETLVLNQTESCSDGWEYAGDVYKETAASHYNWVCGEKKMVPLAFTIVYAAQAASCFIFNPLMDRIGRKPVVIITSCISLIAGTGCLFSPPVVFLVLLFLKCLIHPACVSSVRILLTELVVSQDRVKLQLVTQLAWSLPLTILALIMWLFHGYWIYAGLATTLPLALLIACIIFVPESARWHAAMGRTQKAADILSYIAEENRKDIPHLLHQRVQQGIERTEVKVSMMSLVRHRKQLVRVVIVTLTMIAGVVVYNGVMLNVSNIQGNVYLNFAILGVMDIPGYFFGAWLMDRIGRRFTTFGFLVLNGTSFICAAFLPLDLSWAVIIFSAVCKFSNGGFFMTFIMHCTELFPTGFRSTAMAPAFTFSKLGCLAVPWMLTLGTVKSFLLMAALPLIIAPFYLFLPETHNQSLPQTVEDADAFGEDHKFFALNLQV